MLQDVMTVRGKVKVRAVGRMRTTRVGRHNSGDKFGTLKISLDRPAALMAILVVDDTGMPANKHRSQMTKNMERHKLISDSCRPHKFTLVV